MTTAKHLVLCLVCAASGPCAQAVSAPVVASAAPTPGGLPARVEQGKITYYSDKFAGRLTASGERFDPAAMTMAHRTLPFGTQVKVTVLKSSTSVILRVNDRGPAMPGRIADVSAAAAAKLGMLRAGIVVARLEVVSHATQAVPGKSKKAA